MIDADFFEDCGYWCTVCTSQGQCEYETCLGWCYQNCY